MLHSFFNLFKSTPLPQPQSLTTSPNKDLTPGKKAVMDQDHAEFIEIDLKTLSYAEIASLKLQPLRNKNEINGVVNDDEKTDTAKASVPLVPEIEHVTANQEFNGLSGVRVNRIGAGDVGSAESYVPYSDAIVDDLYFNDKTNRSRKKKLHLKRGKR